MVAATFNILTIDPMHRSCVGGSFVETCRGCGGNAPRGEIECEWCEGRGFTMFPCAHCNPTSAGNVARAMAALLAAQTAKAAATPGKQMPFAPYPPFPNPNPGSGEYAHEFNASCGHGNFDPNNNNHPGNM